MDIKDYKDKHIRRGLTENTLPFLVTTASQTVIKEEDGDRLRKS